MKVQVQLHRTAWSTRAVCHSACAHLFPSCLFDRSDRYTGLVTVNDYCAWPCYASGSVTLSSHRRHFNLLLGHIGLCTQEWGFDLCSLVLNLVKNKSKIFYKNSELNCNNNNKDTSVFVYQKFDTDSQNLENWWSNFVQKTDCTSREPEISHGKHVPKHMSFQKIETLLKQKFD